MSKPLSSLYSDGAIFKDFTSPATVQRLGLMIKNIFGMLLDSVRLNPFATYAKMSLGIYVSKTAKGENDLTDEDLRTIVDIGIERHSGLISLFLSHHLVVFSGNRDRDGDAVFNKVGSVNTMSRDLVNLETADLNNMHKEIRMFAVNLCHLTIDRFSDLADNPIIIFPDCSYQERGADEYETIERIDDVFTFKDHVLDRNLFMGILRQFFGRHVYKRMSQSSIVLSIEGLADKHDFNIGFYATSFDLTNGCQHALIADIFNDPIDEGAFNTNNDRTRLALETDKHKKPKAMVIETANSTVVSKSSLIFRPEKYDALHCMGIPKMARTGLCGDCVDTTVSYFSPVTLTDQDACMEQVTNVCMQTIMSVSDTIWRCLSILGDRSLKTKKIHVKTKYIGGGDNG